jgi:NADH-ubiquinone oxidoreductase chain 4L
MLQFTISVTTILFILGLIMYISNGQDNLIYILISLEILLLAIAILFLIFSYLLDDLTGCLITLYILPLAGAESALGLGILITYYPLTK